MATHRIAVGELAEHGHSASTNTTGDHSHEINIPTRHGKDGATTSTGYFCDGNVTNSGNAKANTQSVGNHTHTVTINNTGSNTPHNNIQPYIAVYIWKRII